MLLQPFNAAATCFRVQRYDILMDIHSIFFQFVCKKFKILTFCKDFKDNTYHFATLCTKILPFRCKLSLLSFMCTHTNPLTYIKGRLYCPSTITCQHTN